ncbi:hypothetical protein NWFMUON74_55250 [Nocardia wallacei]|uniref:Uncharacterized protein n=1 Tax=Nocardia wallacei TaxID=480035 RepID=A0A7G1KU80_9NOCA|nr:hypothetical protein NWFMUON74_55250 [Nocardia wallacei]
MHDGTLGIVVDGIGLVADQQDDRAAGRQCGERLVGGVQKQHPALRPRGHRGRWFDGAVLPGSTRMRAFIGQDMQRSSPRPTIVDVGGLELSVRSGLV